MSNSTQVFLVDQDLIRSMIVKSKLVEDESLHVTTFTTGQECVLNCHLDPSVVVIDYGTKGLHGDDGDSTIVEVMRRSQGSKIVLLCDSGNQAKINQYESVEGVFPVLKGPDFSRKVKDLVHSILASQLTGQVA